MSTVTVMQYLWLTAAALVTCYAMMPKPARAAVSRVLYPRLLAVQKWVVCDVYAFLLMITKDLYQSSITAFLVKNNVAAFHLAVPFPSPNIEMVCVFSSHCMNPC